MKKNRSHPLNFEDIEKRFIMYKYNVVFQIRDKWYVRRKLCRGLCL